MQLFHQDKLSHQDKPNKNPNLNYFTVKYTTTTKNLVYQDRVESSRKPILSIP